MDTKKKEAQTIPVTFNVPKAKWQALQKLAKTMKVDSLKYFNKPISWDCSICPLKGEKCEDEKKSHARANNFDGSVARYDCYGALMRWLLWEHK